MTGLTVVTAYCNADHYTYLAGSHPEWRCNTMVVTLYGANVTTIINAISAARDGADNMAEEGIFNATTGDYTLAPVVRLSPKPQPSCWPWPTLMLMVLPVDSSPMESMARSSTPRQLTVLVAPCTVYN